MTNPADLDPRQLDTLRAIMKALRTPVTGCPWDLEQDFSTIAPYTIEEAYEVADAITRGNKSDLCEELGDLLHQVVYHAQLAAEEESFGFDDVVEAICRKMLRRHPHVFGDEKDLGYVIPEEGATMYQEDACVLKSAPNKENAIKFLQFYTRPEIAALNVSQQTNGTANVPARELTPEKIKNSKEINPPAETMARLQIFEDLGPALRQLDRVWTRVKTAQ